MAVTSQLRPSDTFGEVIVSGWQVGGLLKPSAIKPVITTLERHLVIKRLGRLNDADREALRRTLADILA